MTRITLGIMLLVFTLPMAFANERLGLSIDRVFAGINRDAEPGCVAGVIHDGQYIHKNAYGLANMEHGAPLTSESVFRTGSVGKQFTAMAIAILAERGDLELHFLLPES